MAGLGWQNELPGSYLYEERVVLIKATSFDEAIIEAEKEAKEYADEGSGIDYPGYVNVYELDDEEIKDKAEIYS